MLVENSRLVRTAMSDRLSDAQSDLPSSSGIQGLAGSRERGLVWTQALGAWGQSRPWVRGSRNRLVVFGVMRTWHAVTASGQNPHVATKTVTLIAAEPRDDGVHVRARLDAPSVDATSHELEAVIPTATWNLTHALWACYPPNDPARGSLRTPIDPGCVYFVDAQD